MAMTTTEAQQVNILLDWILGLRPLRHFIVDGMVSDEQAREAAAFLAEKANRALAAGWDREHVRGLWGQRRVGKESHAVHTAR